MTMPSVSDSSYDTPVQSPMNGTHKGAANAKETAAHLANAARDQVNGIKAKAAAGSSSNNNNASEAAGTTLQHAVDGASAYVDHVKDQTSAFYNSHIKPNLPERAVDVVPDFAVLNANVNKFTAAVRDQIAHLDQNEIKEKYADLAHQYYNLLLDSYQQQLQEVQKNGGWKAVPSRAVDTVRHYAAWSAEVIAQQAQARPIVGLFTLLFAALAAVPVLAYATFTAATVATSATLAAVSASVVLGAAGLVFGATLFFAIVGASFATAAVAGSSYLYQRSKEAVRGLGVYAHREEEAERLVATAEKAEDWVVAQYTATSNRALRLLSQAQDKAADAGQQIKQEAAQQQQQSKKRK